MTLCFGKLFFSGSNVLYKWTFWVYMDGINRKKRTNCDVYGTYWSTNKRSSSKVMHILYFISAFCVAPATLAPLLTAGAGGCRLSPKSIKSAMLAGFTTRVALIEYLN